MLKVAAIWIGVGLLAVCVLPWYMLPGDWLSFEWLVPKLNAEAGPAIYQIGWAGRPWLALPLIPILVLAAWTALRAGARVLPGQIFIWVSVAGLALLALQGFAIIHNGPSHGVLGALAPALAKQGGMGTGAVLLALTYFMLIAVGLTIQGFCKGDLFATAAIVLTSATIGCFIFFPVGTILASAFQDNNGVVAPYLFVTKILDPSVWGLRCLSSTLGCGVAWNSVFLGLMVGLATTVLGLAFALIAVRTAFKAKGLLRLLTVLPIITPPFVIGLALILLFGRAGVVTDLMQTWFGIPRTRWIYGFPGVFFAQTLAFTPTAFLILMGVVQGISPSLEEATQTLRASPWATFRTVTLPLMRPGIANAFLFGFVESLADFGNPLVLGGNFDVLSTKVFFAVVGSANDQGRAAVLAIVLLGFTFLAFFAQNRWLGKTSYTTVTGKGDGGLSVPLPKRVRWASYGLTLPWALLTAIIYGTIVFSGFVRMVGRDYTPTLEHYWTAFSFEWGQRGFQFTGAAWDSFWITLEIAAISAPLTAGLGLLVAYLLARQHFTGKRAFEFGTLLSFAIPGTVIGVSYILAFNTPPLELAGTGLILVICFIFRNMPVGVRAGTAALSQIDKSLDEASFTLGASTSTTIRRVILPLLKPAIVAATIYSFVRAMTAVSAVIFLVSARYNLSTAYIVGRVEAGELGLAIAYSTVLIAVMLAAITLIELGVGQRTLGRRGAAALATAKAK